MPDAIRSLRSAFTHWKNGSLNSMPFYAEILAERFARAGRKPPLDPRSLSLAFRTLACGLNLKIPRSVPGRANEAGRIIHELLDLMLEPHRVSSDSARNKTKSKARIRSG